MATKGVTYKHEHFPVIDWSMIIRDLQKAGMTFEMIGDFCNLGQRTMPQLARGNYDPYFFVGARLLDFHAQVVRKREQKTEVPDWSRIFTDLYRLGLSNAAISKHTGLKRTTCKDASLGLRHLRHGPGTRLLKLHTALMNVLEEIKVAA